MSEIDTSKWDFEDRLWYVFFRFIPFIGLISLFFHANESWQLIIGSIVFAFSETATTLLVKIYNQLDEKAETECNTIAPAEKT